MANPLDDIKTRADAVKVAMRAITGAPSIGLRDILSASIASMSSKILGQMQPQQPAQQQPQSQASQAGINPSQPPTGQNPQGSRPRQRLVGTLFRGLFGQRSQQGIQQQQPIQDAGVQDAQRGQPDVAQIQKDLQDKRAREEEERIRRNRRMQKMGVNSGDDRF